MKQKSLIILNILVLFYSLILTDSVDAIHTLNKKGQVLEQAEECVGLDLVVLVDQSSSMKYNDPNGLRFDVLDQIVGQLGDNAMYFCPGAMHRLSVIGFGDKLPQNDTEDFHIDVQEYVRTKISPYRGQADDLRKWITRRNEIKGDFPEEENLYGTDFISAFKMAREVFDSWDIQKVQQGERKKSVFLMTDGSPCILGEGCEENSFDFSNYMKNELKPYLDADGRDFLWRGDANSESVSITVVALNDSTNPNFNYIEDERVGGVWREIVSSHGGSFRPVETDKHDNLRLTTEIYEALNEYLVSFSEKWPCNKPLWVDPYSNGILFVNIWKQGALEGYTPEEVSVKLVYNPGQSDEVEMQDGRSTSNEIEILDYSSTDFIERYVFFQPKPGKYIVEAEGADQCFDLDVRVDKHSVQAEVVEPSLDVLPQVPISPFYDQILKPRFKVYLSQRNKLGVLSPLQERSEYPIDIKAYVTNPEEEVKEYVFHKSDGVEGEYVSNEYISTKYSGTYDWKIVGTTINPRSFEPKSSSDYDDAYVEIIQERGSFQVGEVTTFGLEIIDLLSEVPINSVSDTGDIVPSKLLFQIQLFELNNNTPLNIQEAFPNVEGAILEATLKDEQGNQLETINLESQNMVDGVFKGVFRNNREVLDAEGDYTIEVKLVGDYDRFSFTPTKSKILADIFRYRVNPIWYVLEAEPRQSLHSRKFLKGIRGELVPLTARLRFVEENPEEFEDEIPGSFFVEHSTILQDWTEESVISGTTIKLPVSGNDISANLVESEKGDELILNYSDTLPGLEGKYSISINPDKLQTPRGYVLVGGKNEISINRGDDWWQTPTVYRIESFILACVVIGILVFLVRILFFGPQGSLEVVDGDTIVAGPWGLSRVPSRNTIKSRDLKRLGVKKIHVKRYSPGEFEDFSRAVKVTVYDLDNQVLLDTVLECDYPVPFIEDGDLVYL